MHKVLMAAAATVAMLVAGPGVAADAHGTVAANGHFAYGHPGRGSGPEQVIHIRALDTLRFQPAHVTVQRGDTVKFVIHNAGKLAHEFVIGDAAVQAAHQKEMQAMPGMPMRHDVNAVALPPGQTRELVWTFTRDGTVEYACHVPGHFAAGMIGRISIEPPVRR